VWVDECRYDEESKLWTRSGVGTVLDLGLTIAALSRAEETFSAQPALADRAYALFEEGATFLQQAMLDPEGGIFERYEVSGGEVEPDRTMPKRLDGQLSALQGLLLAHERLGDICYLLSAQDAFDFLESTLWDGVMEVYRPQGNNDLFCYTPLDLGLAVGALERLARASEPTRARFVRERLRTFFVRIAYGADLQLETFSPTGLTHDVRFEDTRPYAPVLARRICLYSGSDNVLSDEVRSRDLLRYVIRVVNATDMTWYDLRVEDELPDGFAYVASTPPAEVSGQRLRWSIDRLPPGDSLTLEIVAFVEEGCSRGKLENCAMLYYVDEKGKEMAPKRSCVNIEVVP
jgi:hypothetical protein